MSSTANCATAGSSYDMRVAALSIALFDFLQTMPGEYRFYRKHWETKRISLVLFLFIGVRYFGAAALATNAIGFFSKDLFDKKSCSTFHLTVPVLKYLASFFSTCIIYQRTIVIANYRKWVTYSLCALLFVSFPIQIFVNVYDRAPNLDKGTCTSFSSPKPIDPLLVYNILNIFMDFIAFALCTFFLVKNNLGVMSMQVLTKHLLASGIMYMLGTGVANIVVYLSLAKTPGFVFGSTLTIAVTMILGTHLILDIQDFHSKSSTRGAPTTERSGNTTANKSPGNTDFRRCRHPTNDPFSTGQESTFGEGERTYGGAVSIPTSVTLDGKPSGVGTGQYELHVLPKIDPRLTTPHTPEKEDYHHELEKGRYHAEEDYKSGPRVL